MVEYSFALKITSIAGCYGLSEMIAVEVKGRNPKFEWEVVGGYRAPNEVIRVVEILAARTGFAGNSTKHSMIGVT